ncbi:MAG: TonB-dependent receptor [Myxococcota bacterium]
MSIRWIYFREILVKLQIFKTQEARFIEGGVSGQILLETLQPLAFGKRRFQVEGKLALHPDNFNIDNNARDVGGRGTLSFVDQFDLGTLGKLGIAIGYQRRATTNPEQEFRTTSAWRDCRADPNNTDGGVFASSTGNCDSGAGDLVLEVDPATGRAPDEGVPFIFAPSSRSYRQNITDDDRESMFAAVQWRPTDVIEVDFDIQYSDRTFTEVRNDLVFAEQRRIVPGITDRTIVSSPTGEVSRFDTIGRIETNSTFQERLEEYLGGGVKLAFQATERLLLTVDASYSNTSRRENIFQTRLQTGTTDIFGNPTPDRIFTSFAIPGSGSDVPFVAVRNFDVNNADLFSSAARTRVDLNQQRDNTITAVRADFEFDVGYGWLQDILGGVRYSELGYQSVPRVRDEYDGFSSDVIGGANLACRNRSFPESGFLSGPSGGQDLITNIDNAGNVISSGSTYASFRPNCLIRNLLGFLPGVPQAGPSVGNIDVDEQTIAAYLQVNYSGDVLELPFRGNFGVRMVHTDVNSVGLRTVFTTTQNADNTISIVEDPNAFVDVVGGGSYLEFLPSLNIVVDLDYDLIMRFGVFRGLSRPDPADLGFGRFLDVDDTGNPMSVDDLVGNAIAIGNPNLKPLTSWNFDAALEWYPDPDTVLAGGVYFKRFIGGFRNVQQTESFDIDGQPLEAPVTTTQTDDDERSLLGFELTAAHAFTYLPGILSGLGAKIGLNVAYSDFEFQDQNFGSSVVIGPDGETDRVGIVEPANIFGFSSVVFSGQAYWEIGDLDLQVIVKHRSQYFQQFISTPGNIRYIADNTVLEARATYHLTKNLALRAEGINLLDEPRIQYNPTPNNLAEVNSYGPRLFVGLRGKFY